MCTRNREGCTLSPRQIMQSKAKPILRLSVRLCSEDQSSTNTCQAMSVVRRGCEKIGNTYRSRSLIVIMMKTVINTNPECNEKRCEGNYAKPNITCSSSYIPQGHYECMG